MPFFIPNWAFHPFLPIHLNDIFLNWSENKKKKSQKNHFLFTERPIAVTEKLAAVLSQNYFGKLSTQPCVRGGARYQKIGGPPCIGSI